MLKKFEDQSKIDEEQHKQRVFVVHGRNEELRKSMFDFLRSIGLKPIEWSQAIQMTGETAPFVGNILDQAFLHAQAVVVLLTGDDEARLRPEYHTEKMPDYERNLTPQSRPNVLFEAGLALGRFPKQTIIVEVGELRPFSDIAGRHTIRLNNSTKTRQDVAQRLATAGCTVDLSGTDWHQTGNFDVYPNVIKNDVKSVEEAISTRNPQVMSKLPRRTNPPVVELADKILLASANKPGIETRQLVTELSIPLEKMRFIINQLIRDGLTRVSSSYSDDRMSEHQVTEKGVKYLIDKDLF